MKFKLILGSILTLLSLLWLVSCSLTDNENFPTNELTIGFINSHSINEASGLVISRINEDIIWINNDGGNEAEIYAVNSRGEHLATLKVNGIENHDWEDLATLEFNGDNYIVIADTGDNDLEGTNYQLHFLKEPKITKLPNSLKKLSIEPEWTINFAFEDKPRDVESIAIDAINEQVLLLSKREVPYQLFTLPLRQEEGIPLMMATRLGEIPAFPAPLKLRIPALDLLNYSNMPTAIDISADGQMAVILTYSSAYLYFKKEGDNWLEAFSQEPKRIDFPTLNQGEAIGFDKSGENIYITSEEIPAPILKIRVSNISNGGMKEINKQ